jgi:hypothetical protein
MKCSTSLPPRVARILGVCAILPVWAAVAYARPPKPQTAQPQAAQPQSQSQGVAAPGGGPSDADASEYKNYRLNMNNVTKYVAATKAMLKLMADNPTLKKDLESQRDGPTIDEAVKTTEKYPEVSAAIESTGLSTRDYVVISGTLMGATMAVGMKKQGQIKAYPTTILPENVAFVEKNYDKLNAMMKTLRQAAGDEEGP